MRKNLKNLVIGAMIGSAVMGQAISAAEPNVTYHDETYGQIILNGTGGTEIYGVKGNTIAKGSTYAVNGGQLYETEKRIDATNTLVGGLQTDLINVTSTTVRLEGKQNELESKISNVATGLENGFRFKVNGKNAPKMAFLGLSTENDTFNFKSGEGITLTAGQDNSITIAANTKKGQISAGDDGFVTGDMVYQAIKDMPVEGSLSGKASTALDNINATGEKKIKDVATNAMLENVETLKDAMGTDEIAENSKDFMTSGAMYTAMHDLQEDWTGTLDSLTKTFAMDDATNLTEENKQKWRATLGTGTNKEGDTGLITGDTLHKALEGINVTGGTVYKAGKHISIGADNTLSVTTDGKVAAGDTGIVTGGQVQEAINKATEGIGTNATVANKADKNLSNLSDAGKNVIKNTLKADLDNKANAADVYTKGETDQKVAAAVKKATEGIATDANVANKADKDLSNLTEAGKQAIKETLKDELAAKADKSYVDTQLKNKVDKTEFNEVKDKVTANETAIQNKADKAYVDTELGKKANAADVFTKEETKTEISNSLKDVNQAVAGKADKAEVTELGNKLDKNVTELKAGKADVNASNIDADAYTAKLNKGTVTENDTKLVSGGTVWKALNEMKNETGAGLVTATGDTVTIAKDANASKIDVSGKNGNRVVTGVVTDAKDLTSAANVGYVNATANELAAGMEKMNSKLTDEVKNAGAVAAALAGLHHLDYDPDNKLDIAVAGGSYRGKNAAALGLFYQPNERVLVSAGATIGADDNAYNVGVSFKVGKGSTGMTTSKTAMAAKIKKLEADKEATDQEMKELKAQVAMLVAQMKLSEKVEKSIAG